MPLVLGEKKTTKGNMVTLERCKAALNAEPHVAALISSSSDCGSRRGNIDWAAYINRHVSLCWVCVSGLCPLHSADWRKAPVLASPAFISSGITL